MAKLSITVLVALVLATLATGCGGDDDGDDNAAGRSEESTGEGSDGGDPIADFCVDYNSPSSGDQPVEEVQTSADLAYAAAAVAPGDVAPSLTVLGDLAQAVVDGATGPVVTEAEVAELIESTEGLGEALDVVTGFCPDLPRVDGNARQRTGPWPSIVPSRVAQPDQRPYRRTPRPSHA